MKANEVFKFIEGFPDYLIGNMGTVYSTIKRKELIQSNIKGYKTVSLIGESGQEQFLVHRLVEYDAVHIVVYAVAGVTACEENGSCDLDAVCHRLVPP